MNFDLFRYVAIGLGMVSGIHDTKLRDAGCTLAAAIDPKSNTHAKVSSQINVFPSLEEFTKARQTRPDFWDVRTPNDSHFTVMRQISELDPMANIIVEKPVCLPQEVEAFKTFLKDHQGKICVNENYLQSNTTKKVKEYIDRFLTEIREVKIEMSKNRSEDFKNGRYQDERGALMYEGSHMLSILKQLDFDLVPTAETLKQRANITLTDAIVEGKALPFQGSAKVNYETDAGIKVEIYSSMEGKIQNGYFFENLEKDITDESQNEEIKDVSRRHRVLVIHGADILGNPTTILGLYAPFSAQKSHAIAGAVFAIKNNRVIEKTFPIPDDTMHNNLNQIVQYFKGHLDENPNSPEDALQIVEIMDTLTGSVKPESVV